MVSPGCNLGVLSVLAVPSHPATQIPAGEGPICTGVVTTLYFDLVKVQSSTFRDVRVPHNSSRGVLYLAGLW